MVDFDYFVAPCPKCGNLLKIKHKLSTISRGRYIPILDDVQIEYCRGLRNFLILIDKDNKCDCGEEEILIMIHDDTFFGFRLLNDYDFDEDGCCRFETQTNLEYDPDDEE